MLHLAGIRLDKGGGGGQIHFQLNGVAQHPLQQLVHVRHRDVKRQDFCHQHLFAAEGQKLAGERAGVGQGFLDLLDRFVAGIARRQTPLQQVDITQNGLHQIVEIVRDAPGQPSHRLHFLRLPVLVLQFFALRNVAYHHDAQAVFPS